MEPKVAHDQVVRMVLVCMVTLIEDEKVDLLNVHETMHEQVVELVRDDDEHVLLGKLVAPVLRICVEAVVLLTTVVPTNAQVSVCLDRCGLLLHQVLRRRDEDDL